VAEGHCEAQIWLLTTAQNSGELRGEGGGWGGWMGEGRETSAQASTPRPIPAPSTVDHPSQIP